MKYSFITKGDQTQCLNCNITINEKKEFCCEKCEEELFKEVCENEDQTD